MGAGLGWTRACPAPPDEIRQTARELNEPSSAENQKTARRLGSRLTTRGSTSDDERLRV
jgi:hypothetical protein